MALMRCKSEQKFGKPCAGDGFMSTIEFELYREGVCGECVARERAETQNDLDWKTIIEKSAKCAV